MQGIGVGRLALWFDDPGANDHLNSLPSHAQFLINRNTEVPATSVFSSEAVLTLQQQHLPRQMKWRTLICRNEIWELWLDEDDRYVFANPNQDLLRALLIPQDFSEGLLKGDFSGDPDGRTRLLPQDLEIVFFVNWLAGFGDVILHAAGYARDGKGTVFVGTSGAGKSTLAASLQGDASLTILGEDQVMLRYLNDQFWVFGTPWHENAALCSPLGVPLERLYFLEKDGNPGIHPMTPADGVSRLLQTAFIPYYRPDAVEVILDRLVLLSERIRFHTLSYRLGEDVNALLADEILP